MTKYPQNQGLRSSRRPGQNRRQWLLGLLRGGALLGIAALSGEMISRGWRSAEGRCPRIADCRRCGLFGKCPRPEAKLARRHVRTDGKHAVARPHRPSRGGASQ